MQKHNIIVIIIAIASACPVLLYLTLLVGVLPLINLQSGVQTNVCSDELFNENYSFIYPPANSNELKEKNTQHRSCG